MPVLNLTQAQQEAFSLWAEHMAACQGAWEVLAPHCLPHLVWQTMMQNMACFYMNAAMLYGR